MKASTVIILIKKIQAVNFSYIDPFVKVKIAFKGKRVFKCET